MKPFVHFSYEIFIFWSKRRRGESEGLLAGSDGSPHRKLVQLGGGAGTVLWKEDFGISDCVAQRAVNFLNWVCLTLNPAE